MRLDKFLANHGIGSRKEVTQWIKKGQVTVNQQPVKEGKVQINEEKDAIQFRGEDVAYQAFYYYMLHKPPKVISATEDKRERTVMDLLQANDYREDLFPVGRLDKDTEGLLLLTNDGQLAHQLLSPKKHIDKEYFALIQGIVTKEDQEKFKLGLTLLNGEPVKPANLTIEQTDPTEETTTIRIVIQEGKFHQVKRMFETVGKKVTYLKRLRMGNLQLDPTLPIGKYRPLTEAELLLLKNPR